MKQAIKEYIERLASRPISSDRKVLLNALTEQLKKKLNHDEPINLNFICTHNSRRSILCQVWSQALADYYNIRNFQAFSGGTEATRISTAIIDSLKRNGYKLEKVEGDKNQVYYIAFSSYNDPIRLFSKLYDDPDNPQVNFTAVLTCSEADRDCPHISGADARLALPYEDPKAYDGKPNAAHQYDKVNQQIATELNYVFSRLGEA